VRTLFSNPREKNTMKNMNLIADTMLPLFLKKCGPMIALPTILMLSLENEFHESDGTLIILINNELG